MSNSLSEVKRWVSPFAAGTEGYRRLVDVGDRTEPDHDEGPFYVLASAYDALQAEVARLTSALSAKQASIDALMLEYCPDEMTAEQLDEWGRRQAPVSAAITKGIKESIFGADDARAAQAPRPECTSRPDDPAQHRPK